MEENERTKGTMGDQAAGEYSFFVKGAEALMNRFAEEISGLETDATKEEVIDFLLDRMVGDYMDGRFLVISAPDTPEGDGAGQNTDAVSDFSLDLIEKLCLDQYFSEGFSLTALFNTIGEGKEEEKARLLSLWQQEGPVPAVYEEVQKAFFGSETPFGWEQLKRIILGYFFAEDQQKAEETGQAARDEIQKAFPKWEDFMRSVLFGIVLESFLLFGAPALTIGEITAMQALTFFVGQE